MIILADMDGVVANFEEGLFRKIKNKYPEIVPVPLAERTTFYAKEQYPKMFQPLVEEIQVSKSFYSDLLPIEGSIEALNQIVNSGNSVFICTSPKSNNPYCFQEKYEWIVRYFGKKWEKQIIISKDKTVIWGDYLIDDKPVVTGVMKPSWEHIIFSQPYNLQVMSKRRIDWQNWDTVLKLN